MLFTLADSEKLTAASEDWGAGNRNRQGNRPIWRCILALMGLESPFLRLMTEDGAKGDAKRLY